MKQRINEEGSSEEEEEEDYVPIRTGGFRMVTTVNNVGPAEVTEQVTAEHQVQNPQVDEIEERRRQQQVQIEAARKRQEEAIQRAKEEAIRLQKEAYARAEAARQQQQQNYGQEQQSTKVVQQQPQQVAPQKVQQQPQQVAAQPKVAQQQPQQVAPQARVAQQQPQQVAPQTKVAQQQPQQVAPQAKVAQQQPQQVAPQAKVAQQQPQQVAPQTKVVQQQPQQGPAQPTLNKQTTQLQQTANQLTSKTPNQKLVNGTIQQISEQPSIKQSPVNRREESSEQTIKLEYPQKSILKHVKVKMGAHTFENTEEGELIDNATRNAVIEDTAWQLQQRVPEEHQPIQPNRIKVPEYNFENEVKPTIVPQPVGYSKVQWNEFPTEEEKEKQGVPRVKTQEWIPENDLEHHVQKINYQPGRIAPNSTTGRLWPPLGYGEEEQFELGKASRTKTTSDDGWIQGESTGENEEENANTPWKQPITSGAVRSTQWPPQEQEVSYGFAPGGSRLKVAWPPVESEEKEQQQVEIIQTHLPVKHHQRSWPPPPPQYAESAQVEVQ